MCYEVIDNNLIFVRNNKARKSNFELLRIIAMILIIAHHFAIHGAHFYNPAFYNSLSTGNKIIVDMLLPGGAFGVALFFMITGYFMIEKKRIKILNLMLEVTFYGFLLAILIIVGNIFDVKYMDMSKLAINQNVIKLMFSPTTSNAWWFFSSYFFLILLSPLINKFFNKINNKGYLLLLILFFILIYLGDRFTSSDYFSLTRGIFFYLIGGYIFKYIKISNKNINIKRLCLLLFSLIFYCCFVFYDFYIYNQEIFNLSEKANEILTDSIIRNTIEAFLVPFIAIPIFLIFTTISFSNKIINYVAKTTFGIYLMHDNKALREFIWNHALNSFNNIPTNIYIIHIISIVIIIFSICSIIDMVRKEFFEDRMINIANYVIDKFKNRYYINNNMYKKR